MSSYLDASVIGGLLTVDPLNARADRFFRSLTEEPVVSDLAAAEFASVVARRVHTRELSSEAAHADLTDFDTWCARTARWVTIEPCDIALADGYLRRLDLALLAPDAIHIAIARRVATTLVTFDQQMARVSRLLGLSVAET